jgi:hypothetical protein
LEADKKILDSFFRTLIFREDFAYVLLGHKPVAFISYYKPVSKNNNWVDVLFSFFPRQRKIRKGWETWKKYPFSHSSVILWEEPSLRSPNQFRIVMANRENFCEVLKNNQSDFEKICGQPVSVETLLSQKQILFQHEVLLGIALGYGAKNAWFFYQTRCIDKKPICLGRWDDDHPILNLPSFVMDPLDPETVSLREIYEQDREVILKYYEGKDFLEATLALFTMSR